MDPLARLALLVVLSAGMVVVSSASAAACTCATGQPADGDVLDVDARVAREVAEVDGDGLQRLSITVVATRNDNVRAGDVVVLSYRTGVLGSGNCALGPALEVGTTYRIEAVGAVGNFRADSCLGAQAVPIQIGDEPADGASPDDGVENRTVGLVTMVVAILGLGFAYLRTKKATKGWND